MARPPCSSARILHLITRLDRGGSATNTLLTVASLPSFFMQCLVYGRTREVPQLALELRGKVEMVEIPELVRAISPLKDLAALLKLYRFIRRGRFDLVHTHTSKAGILGRVAAWLARVPHIVHTPHGHVFAGYYGRSLTTLFVLVERWAATFTDRIIGLTDQEIRDHLERGIGRPGQFVSIPSGIEVEGFEHARGEPGAVKAALGLLPSARLIGSVGRLEPVKGHRHLLEAFGDLAPRFPDLYLALVGEGELLPELRAVAQRPGLADRVLFLGWRDDVPSLLRAFDLFVFPSLNEGMGRALAEAMAAGLPIVASRAGGIPEVLGDGGAGLLVEAGSASALARGIETLLLDPAIRDRLGKAARERARGYSVEMMLRKLEDLYRELLGVEGAEP
jgi:glycosyltransferase involved in cell wall biosynthesis